MKLSFAMQGPIWAVCLVTSLVAFCAHAECDLSHPNPCYNADSTAMVCCTGSCGTSNWPTATCADATPAPSDQTPAPTPQELPAASASRRRTQFMADAKFGIFLSAFSGFVGRDAYRKRLETFDTEGLAAQLAQMEAGYVVFALEQNDGYFPLYLQSYEQRVGPDYMPLAGTPSAPDFITRLANSLHARHIKLIFYVASGAPGAPASPCGANPASADYHASILHKLGYIHCPSNAEEMRQKEFQNNWLAIVREISTRMGSNLAGWYFDGVYMAQEMYQFVDSTNLGDLAAAARSGNPDAAVTFNDGLGPLSAVSKDQDYTAGEMRGIPQSLYECSEAMVQRRDPSTGDAYEVRWHMTPTLAEAGWNGGILGVNSGYRFSDDYLVDWLKRLHLCGGAVSFDVPMHMGAALGDPQPSLNGRIAESFVEQLTRVARRLDGSPPTAIDARNLALEGQTSASDDPGHLGGATQQANDNDVNTAWTSSSSSSDTPRWWQVDLGSSQQIASVEITAHAQMSDPAVAVYDYFILGANEPDFAHFDLLGAQGSGDFRPIGGTSRFFADLRSAPVNGMSQPITSSQHRYIRITRPFFANDFGNYPAAAGRPLNLAEVRLYAPAAPQGALAAPTAASSLRAATDFRQVILRWEPSIGHGVSYTIYRATSAEGVYRAVGTTGDVTFTDRNLLNSIPYTYKVLAVNAAGHAASSALTAIPQAKVPDAPTKLATPTFFMVGGVPLTWSPVNGDNVTYKVYRGLFDGRPLEVIAEVAGTQFLDTQVAPAQWYQYRVTAQNPLGESAPSNDSGALTTCAPPAAGTANVTQQGVTLNWSASAGAAAYNVYRSHVSGEQIGMPYNAQPITTTSFTDARVTPGEHYFYRIVALNQQHQLGGASAEISAAP